MSYVFCPGINNRTLILQTQFLDYVVLEFVHEFLVDDIHGVEGVDLVAKCEVAGFEKEGVQRE